MKCFRTPSTRENIGPITVEKIQGVKLTIYVPEPKEGDEVFICPRKNECGDSGRPHSKPHLELHGSLYVKPCGLSKSCGSLENITCQKIVK